MDALREAGRALQDGRWLIRPPDLAAANMLGDQLWVPYRDVLEAEEPDPDRVRERLEAVPAACAAALEVPGIEDRFAELLRMVPQALAEAEQEQAVQLLGQFGVLVHVIGNGPAVS
ncbi:hypothetical protein ACM01_44230 [Streptomyces viridochromogenes]|uniref:Uncharacterized protein n=1 Tax=Streptomyces viridochromogenes TaxID=1938 RepID=A0A0J7YUC9_STRVR|nr:hypothetical protein ACM01_44230 [Streptomyces viridochromogenes]